MSGDQEIRGSQCVYCATETFAFIPPTKEQIGALGSCPSCDHDFYIIGEAKGAVGEILLIEDANFFRTIHRGLLPVGSEG